MFGDAVPPSVAFGTLDVTDHFAIAGRIRFADAASATAVGGQLASQTAMVRAMLGIAVDVTTEGADVSIKLDMTTGQLDDTIAKVGGLLGN